MRAPTTAVLLLTSLAAAVPSGHGHRLAHRHLHTPNAEKLAERDVVTHVEYQVEYVTVMAPPGGEAAPTAQEEDLPFATAVPAAAATPDQSPPQIHAASPAPAPAAVESDDDEVAAPPNRKPQAPPKPVAQPAKGQEDVAADAAPIASEQRKPVTQTLNTETSSGGLPFNRIVAFGDSFTDNGNGSYAHCVQAGVGDCDNSIYGHGTWTNGPVAVSYLSSQLGVPLAADYAWGWARGAGPGAKMAATIKQSFNAAPLVDSGFEQVANYTSTGDMSQIGSTLHWLWIGNNDIQLPKFQYPDNSQWSAEMADMTANLVGQLVDAGAPYVFVPGLYAKHLAPFHTFMASSPDQQRQMGEAIQQANSVIKSKLESKFGDKVIFYDVFSRMVDILENHDSYGITKITEFCDGDVAHPEAFTECLVPGERASAYAWVNWTDFTTVVHKLIADDMYVAIKKRFGA